MVLLDTTQKLLDLASSVAVIVASGAGLFWFFRRRQLYPRANLTQTISVKTLPNGSAFVQVNVNIENKGLTKLVPATIDKKSGVVVEDLSPQLDDSGDPLYQEKSPELKLRLLKRLNFPAGLHIEPAESQSVSFDFVLSPDTTAIKVYSYLENQKLKKWYNRNRELGWSTTSIYDIR